jgi:hypothetical protein
MAMLIVFAASALTFRRVSDPIAEQWDAGIATSRRP